MWTLADQPFSSRFILGTAQYPSLKIMAAAVQASQAELVTVSLKRQAPLTGGGADFWQALQKMNCRILPNTAGCRSAADAITTAKMAREIFQTTWIKLEVIGDDYTLQPDPFELLQAARTLVREGFEVFPYTTEDLVLAQRLVDCGCRILMPWASPIGSGKGLLNPYALEVLRLRLPTITLIVDAGLGKPSQAAAAMELGYDGVLLNTAVASAQQPVAMAAAFRDAILAGRQAFEAGLMLERDSAVASTCLTDTPFWRQEKIHAS